jgi:hypothetical protein
LSRPSGVPGAVCRAISTKKYRRMQCRNLQRKFCVERRTGAARA